MFEIGANKNALQTQQRFLVHLHSRDCIKTSNYCWILVEFEKGSHRRRKRRRRRASGEGEGEYWGGEGRIAGFRHLILGEI